jgi:quercetin dioxygenase-like cupin family protein
MGGDATPPTATRVALAAQKNPAGVKGKTLSLFRVVVPAHAKLALHHHPGTQIAYIEQGTLTYSVVDGRVDVMKGAADADPKPVRSIKSGQTGKVHAGQWLVEDRADIHRAANNTSKKIVILLSTLLDTGKPPAIPVEESR